MTRLRDRLIVALGGIPRRRYRQALEDARRLRDPIGNVEHQRDEWHAADERTRAALREERAR